ncbi:nitrite reductase small subunit NirD [Aurantivibrio plasticivorans]
MTAVANNWETVCQLDDIAPNTGVCALFNGRQVAIFRLATSDDVFAVDNFDPFGEANVLSRGLIGSIGGELVVASPLYKQHFSLTTGTCLEDETVSIDTFPVRIESGKVQLGKE